MNSWQQVHVQSDRVDHLGRDQRSIATVEGNRRHHQSAVLEESAMRMDCAFGTGCGAGRIQNHCWLIRIYLRQSRIARLQPRQPGQDASRSEEHTSELQSPCNLVCRLLLEKKNYDQYAPGTGQLLQRGSRICCELHLHAVGEEITAQTFFFFNDTATTEIPTLSPHDVLPI